MTLEVGERFLSWVGDPASLMPHPGSGSTWERFEALADTAGEDLSLGRLAEGHADALAILGEAGRRPKGCGPYGVWAARSAAGDLRATPTDRGWRIEGTKGFCSGAGLLDRALVTADAPDGARLFDIPVTDATTTVLSGTWPAVGMAGSASSTVSFPALEVDRASCVGPVGFYTGRIGFWWGATGVAACWWGGARALLVGLRRYLEPEVVGEHQAAAYGSASARCVSMAETLRWAASAIDADPGDIERARVTALIVREVVHDGCVAVLNSAAAAGGARPICLDPEQSRRSADLYAYLAQHHVGRDATRLGRDLLTRQPPVS